MPLPDPHVEEPTQEVDRDTYKLLQEAKAAVAAWTAEFNRLKAKLLEEMGDAYAATIDGEKVYTYRPQAKYAVVSLLKDYPDLTEHFFERKVQNVFNIDKFREQHPEIAEKYRVRALVEVQGL